MEKNSPELPIRQSASSRRDSGIPGDKQDPTTLHGEYQSPEDESDLEEGRTQSPSVRNPFQPHLHRCTSGTTVLRDEILWIHTTPSSESSFEAFALLSNFDTRQKEEEESYLTRRMVPLIRT